MALALQLAAAVCLIVAPIIGIKRLWSNELLAGGLRGAISILQLPLGLYLLGVTLAVVEIVQLGLSRNITNQLGAVFVLGALVIVSGGLLFAGFFQTAKGEARSRAAGNIIGLLSSSQNSPAEKVDRKVPEDLESHDASGKDTQSDETASSQQAQTKTSTATIAEEGGGEADGQPSNTTTGQHREQSNDTNQTTVASDTVDTADDLSTLRRFEAALYLLAIAPLGLLGFGLIDGGMPEGPTGEAIVVVLVGIAVFIALIGIAIRLQWSPGYYVGLWTCGIASLLGIYGFVAPDAATPLGAILLVTLPGIYWGSNSKRFF